MSVKLREKPVSGGKLSLYLDFYPPIVNPQTGKQTRREFLKLYVFVKPKTQVERDHNKETRLLAGRICARRQLAVHEGDHGFLSKTQKKADFLAFFRRVADDRMIAENTKSVWDNSYLHLTDFSGGIVAFEQVTEKFVEDFRRYLLTCKSRRRNEKTLAQNTAVVYFEKFIAVINQAVKDKLLPTNPAANVERIKKRESVREFLTLDELRRLSETRIRMSDVLRRAALFSALTGMRFSDIQNLRWENLRRSDDSGFSLQFVMQKTKENITLPIADEARELMLAEGAKNELVFSDLPKVSNHAVPLACWMTAAGIDKRITFHCFRHTFATLQLTLETDIYTVSKLLGHKNLKTTQIYARIVDEKKREAVNKITLK